MSASFRFAKKWLPYAAAFMLFACGGGSGDDSELREGNDAVSAANRSVPENVFTATLSTAQEAPQTGSSATGIGVVIVDPANRLMRATLTTAGVTGISAHIQLAQSGTNGASAFAMTEAAAGNGVWTVQTTLTAEQLATLRDGNYAFAVRSAAFPEGEIRGRILRQLPGSGITNSDDGTGGGVNAIDSGNLSDGGATANTDGSVSINDGTSSDDSFSGTISRRTTFVNVLTGSQQVPASGSDATAIGVAILDPVGGTMVASITSLGIAGISAHIHRALAGSSGDTIFTLNETGPGSGIWAARLAISAAQLDAFAEGNAYFDIHTNAFPNGEIRGQIVASRATGNIDSGSDGIPTGGTGTGVVPGSVTDTPVTPGSVTGTGNTGSVPVGSAGVPSLGNPVGSGIGSAGSTDLSGTGTPTFGNPAGSGIGDQPIADFGSSSVPPATGFGTGAGVSGTTGSSGGFTGTTTDMPGTFGFR